MINRKNLLSYILITLFALSPLLWIGFSHYKTNHFSCQSKINLLHKEDRYSVIMTYHFAGGAGQIESRGEYFQAGKVLKKISRDMNFTYSRQGDNLVMVSSEKYDDSSIVNLLTPFTPDFFRYSERGLSMKLVQQNAGAYLFTLNETPIFYCLLR